MKTIGRLLLLVILLTNVSSCTALDAVGLAADVVSPKDKPGIDVDAQVGKTNTINDSLLQHNTGDHIEMDTLDTLDKSIKTSYEGIAELHSTQNEMPMWAVVIMCIGWMFLFVTPKQLWDRWRGNTEIVKTK